MPRVLVPTAYRGPTKGVSELKTRGATVLECLQDAESQYSGFLPQVLDAKGNLHPFVKLFINQVQLDPASALATEVDESSNIEILAAIAGG
jgi:molybdopterin converting factor small subunit